MKLVCILLICAITAVSCSWFPPSDDTECGYTRENALACAMRHGDLNHDGKLDSHEIDNALQTLVPRWIRPFAWWKGMSRKGILRDCDYNKDGFLTPRDWAESEETCMPRQEDLCQFKWFCDRADQKN